MDKNKNRLEFYGGAWAGLIPVIVLVGGLSWLSIEQRGGIQQFWAFALIAVIAGIFFAKNKTEYCKSAMRGLADEGGAAIIIAWIFASILGKIMVTGGLVKGILWFGLTTGMDQSAFTLIVYISAMLFAVGTGTSNGTALALAPVFYPAGVFLGADPNILALAILSGGVFGDNLAPISDTTIVSAYTQGASIKDVVRSRFPLAMVAATISGIIFYIAGGGGEVHALPEIASDTDPASLWMLLSLAVVVGFALRGKHLIECLVYGIITAVITAVAIGNLELHQLIHLPELDSAGKVQSTGLIQEGISGVSGAIIFVLLLLTITQVVTESGVMEKLLAILQNAFAKTVRQAELSIIGITVLISIPICSNAPAELLVGPTLVKPLGKKFNLAAARCANLMDCAVCSVFYMLPWHLGVMVWYGSIQDAAEKYSIDAPDISIALYNPYSWAILGVIIFSAITGWNRKFEKEG